MPTITYEDQYPDDENEQITNCSACNRDTINLSATDTGFYCEDCMNRIYKICIRCKSRCKKESMYKGFCRYCRLYELKRFLKPYSPVDIKKLKELDSLQIFGIEIEAIETKPFLQFEHKALDVFSMTEDASLSRNGIEFISQPLHNPLNYQEIHNFGKFAKSHLKIDNSCGLHIHIYMNETMQTLENKKKILIAYMLLEPLFMSAMPQHRRNNKFAKPLRANLVMQDIENIKTTSVLDEYIYETGDHELIKDMKKDKYAKPRYLWLNIHSLNVRDTVEIRLHEGTTNSNEILTWFEINKILLQLCISNDIKTIKTELTVKMFLSLLTIEQQAWFESRIERFKEKD